METNTPQVEHDLLHRENALLRLACTTIRKAREQKQRGAEERAAEAYFNT
jgi:hypothetical protein